MSHTSKRRTSNINSSNNFKKQVKFSENYERSRNLYYSTLVLIVKDKIDELKQAEKNRPDDVFFSQLETMISRHSSQMDRVTKQVIDVRTNLNSQKANSNVNHIERMNKANSRLKYLQKQIKEEKSKLSLLESCVHEMETEETNSKISDLNQEIDQYNFRIQKLRSSNNDIRIKINKAKEEHDSLSSGLLNRKKSLDSKAEKIASKIETTILEINKTETELKELEKNEKICVSLYESLKQPLVSLKNIFSYQ